MASHALAASATPCTSRRRSCLCSCADKTEGAVDVRITLNDKNNPPGKLADAEIHFTDGVLAGLKLIGFAIWERRTGGGRQRHVPGAPVFGERRAPQLLVAAARHRGCHRAGPASRARAPGLRGVRGARRRHDLIDLRQAIGWTARRSLSVSGIEQAYARRAAEVCARRPVEPGQRGGRKLLAQYRPLPIPRPGRPTAVRGGRDSATASSSPTSPESHRRMVRPV